MPIWFGARHPNSLPPGREVRRFLDGGGSSSFEEFKEHAGLVKRYLEEAERDPGEFTVSKRLYLAIDDDESRGGTQAEEWFGQYYGSADLANRVAVWGSADLVAERIEAIAEAGASHVLLNPYSTWTSTWSSWQKLTGLAHQ